MQSNRIIWIVVSLIVLITIGVSLGTMSSHSQQDVSKKQDNKNEDLNKYPVVDYETAEPADAMEREERRLKNKRYDVGLPALKTPPPEAVSVGGSDVEPLSPAIPYAESRRVVIGEVLDSKAFLSNEKKGIYSEYSVQIQTVLKQDKEKKLQASDVITIDRAGGYIRYPNGQKILYQLDWQELPEPNGRYLFFLNNDNNQNPNYKILTGYQLRNNKVTALDTHPHFREFNEMSETDFIKIVLSKK